MTAPAPILCHWDGESFIPASPAWAKRADDRYVVGERYYVELSEERSINSHRHFFASIAEAWKNLPDDQAMRFPTPDHFRKHGLIMTGWRDERTFVCASHAEALRFAAFVRPMDEYAVIVVREAVVKVWTAKSQSTKAQGKKDFQKSKDDVLAWCAEQVGVTADALRDNAARAA